MRKAKSRQRLSVIVVNDIIIALYLALTILVAPVSSGLIQFRISESLDHLVVFNRKSLWGILGRVTAYNALPGFGVMDVVLGDDRTSLSLGLAALLQSRVKNVKMCLVLNTIFFTISMGLIVCALAPTGGQVFWTTCGTLTLNEFIVMAAPAPLMHYLDYALDFGKRV